MSAFKRFKNRYFKLARRKIVLFYSMPKKSNFRIVYSLLRNRLLGHIVYIITFYDIFYAVRRFNFFLVFIGHKKYTCALTKIA